MNRGVGAAIAIICVIVAFVFFPQVMRSSEQAKMREVSETHLVVTGGSETSADVIIYNDLYRGNLEYVLDINSSNTSDIPVATAYNEVTRKLTVGGLAVDIERSLHVKYDTDALTDVTGVGMLLGLSPFLFLGGIIAIIGGVVFQIFRSR
ncbi:hypothetical protein ES703_11518 [subsurface metagenome]